MKYCVSILIFVGIFLSLSAHHPPHSAGNCVLNKGNISYIENKNQWDKNVLFKAELPQGALFLEGNCFTYLLNHPDNKKILPSHAQGKQNISSEENTFLKYHAYKMHFVGSNENVSISGENLNEDYKNYFTGNDPEKWVSGVKTYQTVTYRNIYPNVDLKLYSSDNRIKYDLILHAGASSEQILFEYEGLDDIALKKGNLILSTSAGEQMELKPEAYQIIQGKKKKIGAKYILTGKQVTFELSNYDKQYPLIIDPVVYFATYSGSTYDNWGYTATYDNEGNVYMGGIIFDSEKGKYPTTVGAFQTQFKGGGCDIAIMKLNKECSVVKYATLLGGNGPDMPHSMIVNDMGELIVYGTTGSDTFPTTANAYQPKFGGGTPVQYLHASIIDFSKGVDIFVAKFSADGTQLVASTYVGGSGNDGLNYKSSFTGYMDYYGNDSLYSSYGDGARGEMITDDQGNIYVGSCTFSSDFPITSNAFQPFSGGGQDGVVFKLNANLSSLIWSSYLGGSGDDVVHSVFVDSAYNLVAAGGTNSINFPVTANAYRQNYFGGSADAFVTRITYAGNAIMASTLFGTPSYDQAFFVRLDKKDNIYLLGQTKAVYKSLVNRANYSVENGSQFIAQFNSSLTSLNWSTMFGSGRTGFYSPDLSLSAFGVDNCGRTYVSGWGRFFARGIPETVAFGTKGLPTTADAYQKITDGQDFYVLCLEPNASDISYASFVGDTTSSGGDHVDGGTSRIDKFGTLYQSVCASCGSPQSNFPISNNAYSRADSSDNCNNLVFSLSIHNDFSVADFTATPESGCAPLAVNLHSTGRGDILYWDFGNGETENQQLDVIANYAKAGIYTISLTTDMSSSSFCGSDMFTKTIMVLGDTSYSIPSVKTCPNIPVQIGLPSAKGLTYRWSPATTLTDIAIANPFATVTGNTLYKVIVSNGSCSDTISQWVLVDTLTVDAGNSISSCNSAQTLTATSDKSEVFYRWSSDNTFSDMLNTDPSSPIANISVEKSQYYYVKAETLQGCVAIDSVYVDLLPIIEIAYLEAIKCHGECTAKVRIELYGNITLPARYYWNDEEIFTLEIDNLCAGIYKARAIDAAGCNQVKTVNIKEPADIDIEVSTNHVPCEKVCNGSIRIKEVTGGTAPYTWIWSTGDTTSTIQNLCVGDYSLTVTDVNGCEKTKTFRVLVDESLSISAEANPNTCRPYCTGVASVEILKSKYPIANIEWNTNETTAKINHLCAGIYTVTVTDSIGCKMSQSVEINNIYTFDSMEVWADTNTILEIENTQLHGTQIDGVTYSWSPTQGLSSPLLSTTTAHPAATTTYRLQAEDYAGCIYTDTITINVIFINCGEPAFFIPNAFTPNGDGKNDFFCVESDWVVSYLLEIYNRWGEKVFGTKDPTSCWDGKYKGKECESGVYVYSLDVECKANKKFQTKGDVTLIR